VKVIILGFSLLIGESSFSSFGRSHGNPWEYLCDPGHARSSALGNLRTPGCTVKRALPRLRAREHIRGAAKNGRASRPDGKAWVEALSQNSRRRSQGLPRRPLFEATVSTPYLHPFFFTSRTFYCYIPSRSIGRGSAQFTPVQDHLARVARFHSRSDANLSPLMSRYFRGSLAKSTISAPATMLRPGMATPGISSYPVLLRFES
jgi:hypothetical protein